MNSTRRRVDAISKIVTSSSAQTTRNDNVYYQARRVVVSHATTIWTINPLMGTTTKYMCNSIYVRYYISVTRRSLYSILFSSVNRRNSTVHAHNSPGIVLKIIWTSRVDSKIAFNYYVTNTAARYVVVNVVSSIAPLRL